MTLAQEQIDNAKKKAKEYLEHSIYVLSFILDVNLEEIDQNSTNPVDPANTDEWNSYQSLLAQCKAYIKLQDQET